MSQEEEPGEEESLLVQTSGSQKERVFLERDAPSDVTAADRSEMRV